MNDDDTTHGLAFVRLAVLSVIRRDLDIQTDEIILMNWQLNKEN